MTCLAVRFQRPRSRTISLGLASLGSALLFAFLASVSAVGADNTPVVSQLLALIGSKEKAPVAKKAPSLRFDVGTRQDVFYLGPDRLYVIRLLITKDGQECRGGWDKFLEAQFKRIDANKDGKIDDKEVVEAKKLARNLQLVGLLNSAELSTSTQKLLLGAKKVKAQSLEQFKQSFVKLGATPIRVQSSGMSTGPWKGVRLPRSNEVGYPSLSIFAQLDQDRDGLLSPDELRRAYPTFAGRDFNEDDQVDLAELGFQQQGFFFGETDESNEQLAFVRKQDAISRLLVVTKENSPQSVADWVLAFYDYRTEKTEPEERRLTAKNCRLEPEVFRRYDKNNDEEIDRVELAMALADPAPDLLIAADVKHGKLDWRNAGSKSVAVKAKPQSEAIDTQRGRRMVRMALQSDLQIGSSDFSLQVAASAETSVRAEFLDQFKRADSDNNDYLTPGEFQFNFRFPLALYDLLDADGDKQLFFKELEAGLAPMLEVASEQVVVNIPTALPEILPLVGAQDNFISARTLREAANKLPKLDLDGDQRLSARELPVRMALAIQPGRLNGGNGRFSLAIANRESVGAARETPRPDWFMRMDFNSDDLVSQNEFLGTPEQFAKLDRDLDGYLTPEEAGPRTAKSQAPKSMPGLMKLISGSR